MLRLGICLLAACAGIAASAPPAQAQQTLNFTLGYFTVRGEDARVERDIVVENLNDFAFDVDDFNTVSVGGEWLVPLGEYVEAGAGVGFSRRTVESVYADFVDNDGSEIEQEFRLRLVPVSFTVRVLPLGQSSGFQPYFGAGLGIFNWRYSESGEFIDFSGAQRLVFREQFVASGNETGPIALGGVRFAGDSFSAGAEVRYQAADTALEDDFTPLAPAGNPFRLDLGGWTYQFTVGYRFGR